jgi:DNA-binding NtrC family response regulator
MKIILVADEDEAQAWLLAHTIVRERRYNTLFAAGCAEVRYFVQRIIPHLCIFYSRSSPEEGLACYDSLAPMPSFTSIPTIFITENSERIEHEAHTRNLVLLKPPIEISRLLELVDQLLR